jgi:hypothetical protein
MPPRGAGSSRALTRMGPPSWPVSGSSKSPEQAAPLFRVESLKGLVKEFDRVRLLLGHNNRLSVFAEEVHPAEPNILPGPVKMRAADPRYHPHPQGLCHMGGDPPVRALREGRQCRRRHPPGGGPPGTAPASCKARPNCWLCAPSQACSTNLLSRRIDAGRDRNLTAGTGRASQVFGPQKQNSVRRIG